MSIMEKMKGMLSSSNEADRAQPERGYLDVSVASPAPDAATCQLRFDREVSPSGTSLFETPQDAAGWPVVGALLGIRGVHSVIGKGDVLIVARRQETSWPEILSQVEGAIQEAVGAPGPAPAAPGPAAVPSRGPLAGSTLSAAESALRERIEEVIEAEINPAIAAHGGFIELLDVQDTRVFIHMGGGCQGCAMSTATLKNGVETSLRARIPEITEILDTTDHAAGSNPYFQP